MSLKENIKKDFVEAFRQKNTEKKSVLSMLNSEIKNVEISLKLREEGLSDEQVIEVIKRAVKQRKDAVAKYTEGNRPELAEKEQVEIDILKVYLPAELSFEKIKEVVQEVMVKNDIKDASQMGLAMGESMKALQGQADGNVVRKIVMELLQEK